MTTLKILKNAAAQKTALAISSETLRNNALNSMANCLLANKNDILTANEKDLLNAQGAISEVMLDRLRLTDERIDSMAQAVRDVTHLPDPIGCTLSETKRADGLLIKKVSVPIGLLAMIYESRPNVTSDAAALAIKSGNCCVLRGGKEAINSNMAITTALRQGLTNAGLPADAVCLITDTSRTSATELMTAVGIVDLLIPRGGAGLIKACVENAKVPCIETGTGICHLYIDKSADLNMALDIINNAKTSRPSVCNAAEVLLIHKDIADKLLPKIKDVLVNKRLANGLCPVELRLDGRSKAIIDGVTASDVDFDTEFLDYILAVKMVDSVQDAIEHIKEHSTGHSECIVATDNTAVSLFTNQVDSAAVYVNASTRFTDGGEFGLGCEMGISTQKMHARGPMGLKELTSYKYIITGNGHVR